MQQSLRRLATSIAVLVAVPVAVEVLISYVKGEPYSLPRAAAVLAGVSAVLLAIVVLRTLARQLRVLLEVAMLALGLVVTLTGAITIVLQPRDDVQVVGAAVGALGLLVTAAAGGAIYVERSGVDFLFAAEDPPAGTTMQEFGDGDRRVRLTRFPTSGDGDDEVVDLCRAEVDVRDLHFVGYYVDRRCRFFVDVLDDAELNRFFRGGDRAARRSAFEQAGRQLSWTMSRLNSHLRRLDGGILIRTVLDIEHGALYYCWIDENVYLTGITLDQSRVLDSDEKLRRLANAVGYLPRAGTLGLPAAQRIEQVVVQDDA